MIDQLEQTISRKIESGEGSQTFWPLRLLLGSDHIFDVSGEEVTRWAQTINKFCREFMVHHYFSSEDSGAAFLGQGRKGHSFRLSGYQKSQPEPSFQYSLNLPSRSFYYQEYDQYFVVAGIPVLGSASEQQLNAAMTLVENIGKKSPVIAQ